VSMAGPGLKIKDGLYVGGDEAARELEIAVECKVTSVVNCCAHEVPNRWEMVGVTYLSYKWNDASHQIILDESDVVIDQVFCFIEKALEKGEGVLIHSLLGESRSCCILSAYMMKRYRWSLNTTIEFLKSRRVVFRMNAAFMHQLTCYEERLKLKSALRCDWGSLSPSDGTGADDEMMMVNTFLNSQIPVPEGPVACIGTSKGLTKRIVWSDDGADDREKLENYSEKPWIPLARSLLKEGTGRIQAPESEPKNAELQDSVTDGSQTWAIRTDGGLVHCKVEEIVRKRFGLRLDGNIILLEYEVPARGLRAHHAMKVVFPGFGDGTKEGLEASGGGQPGQSAVDLAVAAQLQKVHLPWLQSVPLEQISGLVHRLRCGSRCAK